MGSGVGVLLVSPKPDLVLRHPQSPPTDWTECPHYSSQMPNECFFNEDHTTVWTFYTIQLRSRDESIVYDQKVLDVADIGERPVVQKTRTCWRTRRMVASGP